MEMLRMSLTVMFHPIDAFEYIKKDRSKFNYFPILILLFSAVAVRAFAIYVTHFPLASIQPRDANIVLEAVKLLLPILTWVLASYAMTTIIDGETLLRETLLAVAYSMLPYILFTIPVTLLSLVMEKGQAGLYGTLNILIWGWVILLFFINLKVMNNYSVKKTILITLLGIFTMVLVWATVALFFALSSQVFSFLKEVFLEFKMKTLG